MSFNVVYPTAAAINEIAPDLNARDMASRVGLQIFPVVQKPTFNVRWFQGDNPYGLMQYRGLDGSPPKVQRLGMSEFIYTPGVYGEFTSITEQEILTRASPGNLMLPIGISDLTVRDMSLLTTRMNDRMEANVWTLLTTGSITLPAPGPAGANVYVDSYTLQTYTASVPWATTATATPIVNIQAAQQLSVGHGASFGAEATLYMNQVTANALINNSNAADFGGRRNMYGATLNNIEAFSTYFQNQGLPSIRVYDTGYQNQPVAGPETSPSTQFTKFIPNNIAVLVGKRPGGQPIGEFQQTIQAMQPGSGVGPGRYQFIKDFSRGINCAVEIPPRVEVHMGFNGGPALQYPSNIVIMTV